VETPALSRFANPDPNIHSFALQSALNPAMTPSSWYLHTSPEFAMKRLVAGGSGPIYQICKVFRGHELGRQHNPEFTMLEWYRPGFSLDQLMDEVDALVRSLLPQLETCEKWRYGDLFERHFALDPHRAKPEQLADVARQNGLSVQGMESAGVAAWLDLLFSHIMQPQLGKGRCGFVFDFPACQCALAQINQHPQQGAARFELIVDGVELANGYYELRDAGEMRRRFESDLSQRREMQAEIYPYDEWVLAALEAGLPDCSGVALGLDRLLMLCINAGHIEQVISFTQQQC